MYTRLMPSFAIVGLLILMCFMAGCNSVSSLTQKTAKPVALPQWVKSPPRDNAESFFGIGEGKDIERAKSAALADIAGKLMTSVASDTTIRTVANANKVEEDFRRSVKTQVQDTKLSHFEVVELQESRQGYWALIKLSRAQLISSTARQWNDKDDRVVADMQRFKAYSVLERYLLSSEIEPQLVKARSLMLLLRSADPSFDYKKHNSQYLDYEGRVKNAKHQLQFSVQTDRSGKQVAKSLVDLLSAEGFKANITRSKSSANIEIETQIKYLSAGREKMAQLKTLFSTSDAKGRVIANKEYTAAGSSLTSNDMAMQQAVADLKYTIEDQGVLYSLGLEKD